MGSINRTRDPSAQRFPLDVCVNGALTNGETGILCHIPFPCVLDAANLACFNTTAGAQMLLTVSRFIVGTGVTTWNLGSTFAPPAFGTSGVIPAGVSLPASGSTLNILTANDVIGYQISGGVTVGIFGVCGTFVVRPLQDVSVYLGLV